MSITKDRIPLPEAINQAFSIIKNTSNSQLKQTPLSILAEITNIKDRVYGGNQYIDAVGDGNSEIQLIVPSVVAVPLQLNKTYAFEGTFEIPNNINYGFIQFRVTSASLVGEGLKLEARKQAAAEIIEKGYLKKYKFEFNRFRGKTACKVALVTSDKSRTINDVLEVFKLHPKILVQLYPVKLRDAEHIADGIRYASQEPVDVIMVVRGGGSDSDFEVFDEPCVVKAIFESKIPVIVGIGHTDNMTFADQAADRSETTPTKAANFLVEQLGQVAKEQQSNTKPQQKPAPYHPYKKQRTAPPPSKTNQIGWTIVLAIVMLIAFVLLSRFIGGI